MKSRASRAARFTSRPLCRLSDDLQSRRRETRNRICSLSNNVYEMTPQSGTKDIVNERLRKRSVDITQLCASGSVLHLYMYCVIREKPFVVRHARRQLLTPNDVRVKLYMHIRYLVNNSALGSKKQPVLGLPAGGYVSSIMTAVDKKPLLKVNCFETTPVDRVTEPLNLTL